MALIALAIYDTPENNRAWMTEATLNSLLETVDFTRHRVFLVVNASTDLTRQAISDFGANCPALEVIYCDHNVGTARAINKAWKHRKPGEHCIKMDNDVVIHQRGWADLLEDAVEADTALGLIGLKRSDVCQREDHQDPFYRIQKRNLVVIDRPIEFGRVTGSIKIEETADVMGTCVLHSSALLDEVGYLYQPGLYGFDDVLMCVRSICAGFYNAFLSWYHVTIDHIDPGNGEYQTWKHRQAHEDSPEYHRLKHAYQTGAADLYCPADY